MRAKGKEGAGLTTPGPRLDEVTIQVLLEFDKNAYYKIDNYHERDMFRRLAIKRSVELTSVEITDDQIDQYLALVVPYIEAGREAGNRGSNALQENRAGVSSWSIPRGEVRESKKQGYTRGHGGTVGDETNSEDELVTLARHVPSEKRIAAINFLKNLAGGEVTDRATDDTRLGRLWGEVTDRGTMGDAAQDLNALAGNLGLSFEEAAAKLTAAAAGRPKAPASDNPLRQARRLVRNFDHRRARNPDVPEGREVVAARSFVNRVNYQNRKAKTAKP